MIDIKKAKEVFKSYASNYDMSDIHIERKVSHTFRVESLCEKIAISINRNEEEINLAKLIGILHDIARFEQYTTYKTFADHKSIDHGELGVEILKKDNYIRQYIETDKYDEIIKKAIFNHNKYTIEPNVNEKEKIFCKIIRDADKLDIMYQLIDESFKDKEEDICNQNIEEKVLIQFMSKQLIDSKNVKNDIDKIIRTIAFIYDFNFKESYKIIKENNYINKIIDRFNFKNEGPKIQIELVRKIANDYINNQVIKDKNN